MPIKSYENTINKDLLQLLRDECLNINNIVTKEMGSIKDNKYNTFWINKNDKPRNFIEYLVLRISLQDYPIKFPENYIGCEWWIQVKDKKENITFHYDKDEALTSLKDIYIYPLKSTITYLTDVGGPTMIFNDENYNNGYLSFPKENKHVVFDGHLFHGVIGSLGTSKPSKGQERITLLINYWNKKPEEPNCIRFPCDKYSLLPLKDEYVQLQESIKKGPSKIFKMNYKSGVNNLIIYRHKTPIPIKVAKNLKEKTTYSFRFNKDLVMINTSNY